MPPLRNVAKGYSERFLGGLDRALAVRPEHRPQSIAEFRSAIGVSAGASGASPIGQRQTSDSPPRRVSEKSTAYPNPAPLPRSPGRTRHAFEFWVTEPRSGHRARCRIFFYRPRSRRPQRVAGRVACRGNRSQYLPSPLPDRFGLLFFMMGEPRDAPPAGADTTASAKASANGGTDLPPPSLASAPVLPMAESSSPVATRGPATRPSPEESSAPASNRQVDAATGVPDAVPGRASGPPPVAGPMSPGSAASGAGRLPRFRKAERRPSRRLVPRRVLARSSSRSSHGAKSWSMASHAA